MDQIFPLDDMIDMVRRRFRVIAAIIFVGSVAALFFAASQTHLYRSAEVLQVARPTIDNDLARSTVDGSSARRLQLIEQQLMTRGTMLEVAEQFGVFDAAPEMLPSERVSRMRDAIRITGVAAAREGYTDDGTVSVLTITATFDTPQKAQAIAHEFARRTIDISASSRIEQARETLRFFSEEETKQLGELDRIEREITAYQRDNNLAIEGGLELRQTQIAAINEAILGIERERIALEQDLSQLDQTQRAATLERLQSEIGAQIEVLNLQQALLEARLAKLAQAIKVSPQIERDLAAFERQRQKLQDELNVIAARRAEAEVGLKLEEQRQAERLTVIEPAALPDYPVTPSRKRTALIGMAASVFLGLLAAFLLDLRHPVIRSARQMQSRLGITPVVTIPPLEPSRRSRKRFANARIALAGYIHETRNRHARHKDKD